MSGEKEARDRRIVKWIRAGLEDATYDKNGDPNGPGDTDHFEDEVYWGVFVVDGPDTRPVAMFCDEDNADQYREWLASDKTLNAEYAVSPCVLAIEHRDNFEVPK